MNDAARAWERRWARIAAARRGRDGWRLRLSGELFEHGGSVMVTEPPEEDGGDQGEGDAAPAPSSPE